MIQTIPEWDKKIFYAINGFRAELFDTLMPVFSFTWLLWALSIAAFALWAMRNLCQRGRWNHFKPLLFGMALILITAGVTDLATQAIKSSIGRLRPYQSLPFAHFQSREGWQQNSKTFVPNKHRADSFFSGHAAHSMAVAVTASTLCPPLAPFVYAMPLTVGYSRIYLGKHYPSDVLAGWFAGAFIALLARRATCRIRARLRPKPARQKPESPSCASAQHARVVIDSTRSCTPSKISQDF